MISQKEAVYQAVVRHRDSNGIFDRAKVINDLVGRFSRGEIEHKDIESMTDTAKCRTYCSGLLSNWLRKDTRLSGTEAFSSSTRAPRSKRDDSPADPEMKRLIQAKALLRKDGLDVAEIDALINKRQSQLDAAKQADQKPVRDAITAKLLEAGVDLDADTPETSSQEE